MYLGNALFGSWGLIPHLSVCTCPPPGAPGGRPCVEHKSVIHPHRHSFLSKGPPNNGQPVLTQVQTSLWSLPSKAIWKLPLICWPRSDRANKWLLSRRKEPSSEQQPRPHAHTKSKRHLSEGPVTGKKFFYLFIFGFSSRQNVCSSRSSNSSRSAGNLPSDLLVPSLIAPHLASGKHKDPRPPGRSRCAQAAQAVVHLCSSGCGRPAPALTRHTFGRLWAKGPHAASSDHCDSAGHLGSPGRQWLLARGTPLCAPGLSQRTSCQPKD